MPKAPKMGYEPKEMQSVKRAEKDAMPLDPGRHYRSPAPLTAVERGAMASKLSGEEGARRFREDWMGEVRYRARKAAGK